MNHKKLCDLQGQFCFNYHVIAAVMYDRNYLFPNMNLIFEKKFGIVMLSFPQIEVYTISQD